MKGTSLTSTTPVLVNICLKLLLNKIHEGPLVLPLVLRQASGTNVNRKTSKAGPALHHDSKI